MQTLQGFKSTDAGLIPEDWNALQVRDVCRLINGRGFKPYEWSDRGLPIIRIQNLNGSNNFNCFHGRFDQKILIQNGQLLFAWSGSRGTSFGPHIWTGNDAVLNYHTWKIVPNEKIDKDYLYFALRGITSFIEDNAHGASALVHTQKWEMEGFYLAVPPADEQAAIAGALQDADEVVSSLKRLIAKKQAVKQGMMQQLLTGKNRLPGFDSPWRRCALSDVLTVRHGRSQHDVEQPDGQYPILATGGEIGRTNTPLYSKPSVLIGRKGTIDRPQYRDEPFWTVDTLFYTEIHEPNVPKYVYYLFLTIDWRSKNEASGVPSLSSSAIESISTVMPGFEEQRAITKVLTNADAELHLLETRLAKAKFIKIGMMQELLTGRTRLQPAKVAV